MGKDSLLESTSKKKAAAKADKGKPAKKKTAAKKAASTKSTAKGKSTAKSKKSSATKAKKATAAKTKKSAASPKTSTPKATAPKKATKTKSTTTKAKKAATKAASPKKAAAQKPTRKALLWKKFTSRPPGALYSPPQEAQAAEIPHAPSFFAGMSDDEARKAKEYLKRQFDWTEIQAAGEKYAAQLAAKAEEEAKRKAEEEAKRKAEEEAKRKAEEEAKRKAEEEAKRKAEEEAKRKAAEQTPPPPVDSESRGGGGGFNPLKIGIIAFCAIILILIVSSYSNTKHYYIQEKDGAVEIWRGIFAPMGQTRLMILPGIQMPAEEKEVYGWQDAYRLMYQYYIEKADAILEVPGVPDTAALTANLEKAIQYAPNRELRDKARSRLVSLHMQTLVQKAQAALNRETIESAEAAIGFLEEAARLDLSQAEADMVQSKIEAAETVRAEREAAQAEAEKAAAEQAALEQEAQTLQEAADNQPPAAEADGH